MCFHLFSDQPRYILALLTRVNTATKQRRREVDEEVWRRTERPLTFALLAISLVARLADAVVGLGCVLAEGVNVAVVRTLGTLVCICTSNRNTQLDLSASGFNKPWCWVCLGCTWYTSHVSFSAHNEIMTFHFKCHRNPWPRVFIKWFQGALRSEIFWIWKKRKLWSWTGT